MSVRNDWWKEPKKNDVCGWLMWNAEIPDEFSPRYNCTHYNLNFLYCSTHFHIVVIVFFVYYPSFLPFVNFFPTCFVLLFRINKLLSSNFILFKTFSQRKDFYWFKRGKFYIKKWKKNNKIKWVNNNEFLCELTSSFYFISFLLHRSSSHFYLHFAQMLFQQFLGIENSLGAIFHTLSFSISSWHFVGAVASVANLKTLSREFQSRTANVGRNCDSL